MLEKKINDLSDEIREREARIAMYKEERFDRFFSIAIKAGFVICILCIVVGIIQIRLSQPLSNGMAKDDAKVIFEQGKTYYEHNDYENVFNTLCKIPSDSKHYNEARKILDSAESEYVDSVLKMAKAYVEQNDYHMAIGVLDRAIKVLPDNVVLSDEYTSIHYKNKEYSIRTAKTVAEEHVRSGDYPDAIRELRDTLSAYNDPELSALLTKYESEYAKQVANTAKSVFQEDGYEKAMSVLSTGQSVLEDDANLTELAEEFRDKRPVSLFSIEPYKTTDFTWSLMYYPSDTDALGNEYSNVYINGGNYLLLAPGSAGAKYYLNEQYSSLTGKIAIKSSEAKGGYIEILGDDDIKLYTSPIINGEEGAVDVNVDLTGVKFMTLYVNSGYATNSWDCNKVMMIDFQLRKA